MNYKNILVADLDSGSYLNNKIGHELFNFKLNEITGKYYGYVPSHSNVEIRNFDNYKVKDKYVEDILVVYTTSIDSQKNRKIIGFAPNSKVYASMQSGENLNRSFIDKDDTISVSGYAVESDQIIDLRMVSNPFIIEIRKYNNQMYRRQRFYGKTYPELSKLIIEYFNTVSNYNNVDDYNDNLYQYAINNERTYDKPKKSNTKVQSRNVEQVTRDPRQAKHAIYLSKFKCEFDNSHTSFLNNNNDQYMEGHHLIPLTIKNLIYFKEKFNIDLDDYRNIVSLCPTCHRAIHLGNDEYKKSIIKKIFESRQKSLSDLGVEITLSELLEFYNVIL